MWLFTRGYHIINHYYNHYYPLFTIHSPCTTINYGKFRKFRGSHIADNSGTSPGVFAWAGRPWWKQSHQTGPLRWAGDGRWAMAVIPWFALVKILLVRIFGWQQVADFDIYIYIHYIYTIYTHTISYHSFIYIHRYSITDIYTLYIYTHVIWSRVLPLFPPWPFQSVLIWDLMVGWYPLVSIGCAGGLQMLSL